MLKPLFFIYAICFGCYILFVRTPDFFDGETMPAIVIKNNDTSFISYNINKINYKIIANYPLRSLQNNQKVTIIYNVSNAKEAVIYTFWGYWITWGELLMSIILIFLLYQIAVSITSNPSLTAIKDQEETEFAKPKKYI
jgi:hypothetical protein